MTEITLHQAIDLFTDDLTDIERSMLEGLADDVAELERDMVEDGPLSPLERELADEVKRLTFADRVKRIETIHRAIEAKSIRHPVRGLITDAMIERAKAYPIERIYPGKLRHAGSKRWTGTCPMHKEKTASFYVFTSDNHWYCFGACQKGGDVISLYRALHGVSFPQAVRALQ
jgi:hypothetical protein